MTNVDKLVARIRELWKMYDVGDQFDWDALIPCYKSVPILLDIIEKQNAALEKIHLQHSITIAWAISAKALSECESIASGGE